MTADKRTTTGNSDLAKGRLNNFEETIYYI